MKKITLLIIGYLLAFNVYASNTNETLACLAGASADITGSKSFISDASNIRFLLTLTKQHNEIKKIKIKYIGDMEALPSFSYQCTFNKIKLVNTGRIYNCSYGGNGSTAIWYYPERQHGVIAGINITDLFKENRLNSGGIYNYSCTQF
ncbi:MAG: hypothetical protein U9N57_03815 [Pseudomonadota bacterium]|nr:hypothetical protein [Pseudomonadota bacterium]